MLKDHVTAQMKQNLGHPPTPGQEQLISKLAEFLLDPGGNQAFIVKGFAGTGKTTLISALVKTLDATGQKSLLLAPTGRAAKVFSAYSGRPAFTIHRKIYRQKSSHDGFGTFSLNKNLFTNLLVLVDEASMISNNLAEDSVFGSGRLLEDLIAYVRDGNGCKLILIGDTAQLPPVGTELSPALDRTLLNGMIRVSGEFVLTDIVRQTGNSGILVHATGIRRLVSAETPEMPVFRNEGFRDVRMVAGNELPEFLESAYDRFGIEESIVVCRSNKKANQYNAGIRKMILGREETLEPGDLLMVVKNNYHWITGNADIEFIANGDIVRLKKVRKYEERYGFRFAFASLHLIDFEVDFDAWILLDTLMSESAALSSDDNRKLYYSVVEDFSHLPSKAAQYKEVKKDPFFNALQVKYAYAVTCHKAQGGQWKGVFVDQGYVNKEKVDREYLRWIYTAVTRASEELYLVNFPDEKSIR